MRVPWRPLALAAAINVTVGVGVLAAQTVIVTKAPPGAAVELALDAEKIATATAAADGSATLAVNLPEHGGKSETDVHIYVDSCGDLRRVVLVEPGMEVLRPGDDCTRREVPGLFVMRKATSFLIDLRDPAPTVRLRQGPVPAEWLTQEPEQLRAAKTTVLAPKGFMLSGGLGFVKFRDARALACGDVASCTGKSYPFAYTAGVTYWVTRYLGVDASWMKPRDLTAEAAESTYSFSSALHTNLLAVTAKVGVPVGRARLYGEGGGTYHRTTSSTTETVSDYTVTVDEVTQTITGGTQSFGLRTSGWGWLFGGGMEIWATPRVAIYVEGGRTKLTGKDKDGGEGLIDDRVTFVMMGVRVRLGG